MKNKIENRDDIDQNLTPKGRRNYVRLLEYLSDPDNDWPCRQKYSTLILGYKKENAVYRFLSPQALNDLEDQAFENRKKRSARQRAMVRQALFKKAVGFITKETKVFKTSDDGIITKTIEKEYPPDPVAAREFLDRTEGKVTEKHQIEHTEKDLSDDELDSQIAGILADNEGLKQTLMEMLGVDGKG